MVVGLIFTGTSTETLELGLFIGGRVFLWTYFSRNNNLHSMP